MEFPVFRMSRSGQPSPLRSAKLASPHQTCGPQANFGGQILEAVMPQVLAKDGIFDAFGIQVPAECVCKPDV